MRKGPETIDSLRADLDDAHKEIAWLRQCIYGSAKVAKLEAEIERLEDEVSYWKHKEHETKDN